MDNQTNPTTPPEKQESKIPEPPALEIDIRTMESDIKAFNEGGGEVPTAGAQESFASNRQDDVQKAAANVAPAYTGPEKPLFETPVAASQPTAVVPSASESTGTMKAVVMTVGIVVAVIGVGLLGYFVLFPYIFKVIGK